MLLRQAGVVAQCCSMAGKLGRQQTRSLLGSHSPCSAPSRENRYYIQDEKKPVHLKALIIWVCYPRILQEQLHSVDRPPSKTYVSYSLVCFAAYGDIGLLEYGLEIDDFECFSVRTLGGQEVCANTESEIKWALAIWTP